MPDKKTRRYHICLLSSHGEQSPDISILADDIVDGDYPMKAAGRSLVLFLEGEQVGVFANRHVVGWWTTEPTERPEPPNPAAQSLEMPQIGRP